jgi:hypothetical protein
MKNIRMIYFPKIWKCFLLFSAVLITTLANLEGEETFEQSFLGHADEVVQERICDDELILVKGYVACLCPFTSIDCECCW